MISILGAVVEFAANIRRERQAEGIIEARKKGVYKREASFERDYK